ncbi:TIGR03086 family metal-binding protein [Streptomyces sp. NPDC050560]|uniref:TIGR03086 family metal-binding protein n=1 Tax=Streptomyces sp. NPDC050560 TaxID=3365630 RepID=UPI0037A39457
MKERATDLVSDLADVLDEVARLVESLDERRWAAPTPCDDWDVRAVVDHLLDLQRNFRVTMTGEAKREDSAFRDNAAVLPAAFREQGALERTVTTRLGPMPGATALNILTMEHLAHGWDLARAVGHTPSFDTATTERAIAFATLMSPKIPPPLAASNPHGRSPTTPRQSTGWRGCWGGGWGGVRAAAVVSGRAVAVR